MIDLAHSAGRYGAYIWPAYGVSLLGIVAMALDTAIRSRRWRREVDRRLEKGPSSESQEGQDIISAPPPPASRTGFTSPSHPGNQ